MLTQNNDIVLALHRNGEIEKHMVSVFTHNYPKYPMQFLSFTYFGETIDIWIITLII